MDYSYQPHLSFHCLHDSMPFKQNPWPTRFKKTIGWETCCDIGISVCSSSLANYGDIDAPERLFCFPERAGLSDHGLLVKPGDIRFPLPDTQNPSLIWALSSSRLIVKPILRATVHSIRKNLPPAP